MNWAVGFFLVLFCIGIAGIGFTCAEQLDPSDEWRIALLVVTVISAIGAYVFTQIEPPRIKQVDWFHGVSRLVAFKMQLGLVIASTLHFIGQAVLIPLGTITIIMPAMTFGWWRDSNLRHHSPLWGMLKHGGYNVALWIFICCMTATCLFLGMFSKKYKKITNLL